MFRASYRKTMALTDLLKSARSFGKGLSRKAVIGAVGLASYLGAPSQQAKADIYVDPSWTYQEINNVIDGDPLTKGKDNTSDLVANSNETLWFTIGSYTTAADSNASFRVYIPGITIDSNDPGNTYLQNDPQVSSGVVMRIYATGITVRNLNIRNAKFGFGLEANFSPSAPICLTNNTIQNVGTGMYWNNVTVSGDNSLPSVIVDGNYIRAVSRGNIFNKQSEVVDGTKAWAQVSNNTFEDISTIVFEPPTYGVENAATGTIIVLGLNQFDGNVNINSNGVTLPDSAYGATGGPLTSATTASTDIPDANGEHHININPCISINPPDCCPNSCLTDYMSNVWHGNNVASADFASAKITWSRRLLSGSPHWADGKCKNPNGSERHYCGAFPPMGDWNADGKVDDYDEGILETKKTGPGVPAPSADRQVFDFDNDGDIDNDDHIAFLNNNFQGIPNIPTVSQWGLGISALLLATAGTLLLRVRRETPSPYPLPQRGRGVLGRTLSRRGRCAGPESS